MTTIRDHWYPDYTTQSANPPKAGDLIAWEHTVWRVLAVQVKPESEWTDEERRAVRGYKRSAWDRIAPATVTARPLLPTTVGPGATRQDLFLHKAAGRFEWHIYRDEHYPVCAQCGEPTPCRERVSEQVATREMAVMARYETPGVCPACAKPISTRQKSMTFQDNVKIPGGPAVTFHIGRGQCRYGAAEYEEEWAAANPARRTTLSCLGEVTNHSDGTYDCTAGVECRGPMARHESYATCDCAGCWTKGGFDCHPAESSVRRGADADLFGGAS